MKIPGGMAFINSSKGMKSFGLGVGDTKTFPPVGYQLPRKLNFSDWVSRNCTQTKSENSAICLMQKGYKIGEFICTLRILPLQDPNTDLILQVVQGVQAYVDSIKTYRPGEAPVQLALLTTALSVVLTSGNYAKRRLGKAQPAINGFEDLNSLFEKLKSANVLGLVTSQIEPYGLMSAF